MMIAPWITNCPPVETRMMLVKLDKSVMNTAPFHVRLL